MPGMKTCAVSIDLDPIGHYYGIHGIPSPPEDLACTRGLERFLALADARGFKATLFVIGAELARPGFASLVRDAAKAGHEIANHSLSHRYDLSRLGTDEIRKEITDAHDRIADITGTPPRGFRAPGYTLSPGIIATLDGAGYAYDSSAFSSWPYYCAKAVVMALSGLIGRRSAAIMSPLSSLFAPTSPYHPASGAPYRRGAMRIVEVPITVSPWLRLPLIGTTFILAGPLLRGFLLRTAARSPRFNLEFHGIDFLGCDEVGGGLLRAGQIDARMALDEKAARVGALFDRLREHHFVTLDAFVKDLSSSFA